MQFGFNCLAICINTALRNGEYYPFYNSIILKNRNLQEAVVELNEFATAPPVPKHTVYCTTIRAELVPELSLVTII